MTDRIRPVQFRWREVQVMGRDGKLLTACVMVPHTRFETLCKRQFELDEDYALEPVEKQSGKSRASFFINIGEVWSSLPKEIVKRFPSEEHLRKWALVQAGHCTVTESGYESERDAIQAAKDLRAVDAYAVIVRVGAVVRCKIAKSISPKVIKGQVFQEVKLRALAAIAELAGVKPEELNAHVEDGGSK